ncbi:MAG: ThiF family adenylyltransferase [Patescibacteria group bacterium]
MQFQENEFYKQAFSRNLGLLTTEEQEKISRAKIAIAGLGGVGGIYFLNLVRIGVKNFNIADFDVFELPNINRQVGADINSLGKSKIDTLEKMAKSINPFITIQKFGKGVDENNIGEFLKNADVVLDGLDFFNIKDRIALFREAKKKKIYAITSAPVGFGASLLVFSPKGMSFEEYFDIKNEETDNEKLFSFALGLSPSLLHRKYFKPSLIDFSKKKAPSLSLATLLCANLTSCEVIKIILGKKVKPAPFCSQFDPYLQKYKKINLRNGNRNFIQRFKKWIIKKKLAKSGNL